MIPLERRPAERPWPEHTRVTVEDLDIAIEWLNTNEGDDGELDACRRVADWLRKEQERRIEQAGLQQAIKQYAKENGVKPRVIRKALKEAKKAK